VVSGSIIMSMCVRNILCIDYVLLHCSIYVSDFSIQQYSIELEMHYIISTSSRSSKTGGIRTHI
jgi:hypothetical protein